MGRSGIHAPPLITFRRMARSRPSARSPACGWFVRWFRSARSRPPVPLPPPRAPLRSLLPPAARRFAPAPRWSVLLNCGGARRACGAGRPRRALASLGLRASACPPALADCPPCRRALLYALAVRRKGYTSGLSPARCAFPLRAFRALMAAAAGVCGECFLISLDNTETIGSK